MTHSSTARWSSSPSGRRLRTDPASLWRPWRRSWRTVRAVLTQRGALDPDTAPGDAPSGQEPIRVASYKLTPAKPGTGWTMTPDECRLISDNLGSATDGDITAAQEALRGTHERCVLANPREVCESWAAFFDECAGLGGLSVTTLPSSIEDW
jgi:hypothetical protein